MERTKGKVVIVTGGTGTIGSATVRLLAAEGAKVLFCGTDAAKGELLAAELLQQGAEVLFTVADVRQPEENERLVCLAVEKFGKLDSIVCCAGKQLTREYAEYDEAEWLDAFSLNCDAAFYLSKYAIPEMRKNHGGSIVYVGDGAMDMPVPKMGASLAAKMALVYLCRQIGVENCRANIRANIVSPTLVAGGYWDEDPGLFDVMKCCANGRHTFTGEDAAQVILFMVSDESRMLSAVNIKANDGFDCGFAYDQWAGIAK